MNSSIVFTSEHDDYLYLIANVHILFNDKFAVVVSARSIELHWTRAEITHTSLSKKKNKFSERYRMKRITWNSISSASARDLWPGAAEL